MSLLLALVGFAAIVAVYSTIVSVVVEGIHKLFALRSAGMSEMLRNFYDHKLGNLQPSDTPAELGAPTATGSHVASPQSRDFARTMTRRAASENLRPWYIRRWPLIGQILSSRVQRMSTLQFIERLAETPEGKALAGHSRPMLRRALSAAAYEFERIGEAQTDYFRSRASMVSVLAGIAVAFVVNLDAITLYKELATNATLSARLSTIADTARFQQAQAAFTDEEGQARAVPAVFEPSDLDSLKTTFLDMGVPVGRKMFPHCENYKAEGRTDISSDDYRDERCGLPNQTEVNQTWQLSYADFRDQRLNGASASWPAWFSYRWSRIQAIGENPGTFAMWFLGVLIGGGLLGLGAPFWFKLFARGAAMVAPMARLTLSAPGAGAGPQRMAETAEEVRAARPGNVVRNPNRVTPAELERAYLTVMGRGTDVDLLDDDLPDTYAALGSAHRDPPPGRIIGTLPPEVAPDE
ncbi:MAG: hypothetical protein AAFO88_04110 [Pseudomonadota bacterium]